MREIRSTHKLGQYRVAAGFSQKGLADLAKCSVGTIHMLESGQSRFTREWALRLSPFLGVAASELLAATGRLTGKDAVSARVRDARVASGIASASEAAKRLDLPYWKYSGHETAKLRLREEDAQRYADAFGVTAAWLLNGEGEGPKPVAAPVRSFLPAIVPQSKPKTKQKRRKSLTASESAKRAWVTRKAAAAARNGLVPLPLPATATGGSLLERLSSERDALTAKLEASRADLARMEHEVTVLTTMIGQLSTAA